MSQPAVIVIDDDPAVLDSLVSMLTVAGHRVCEFASALTFLDALPGLTISCIVTDIRLPQIDGLTLIQRLKERGHEATPVIVISGHADVPIAVAAMQMGAMTVLEKPFPPGRLLTAVRDAIEGARPGHDAEEAIAIRQRYETLTTREREVMANLTQGASSKVTAIRLGISPRTVDVFRGNILRKMEASNVAGLATQAAKAKL